MYSIEKYRMKIRAQLPNGLYRFTRQSATGKTYLTKVLNTYRCYGEPVGTYTYWDFQEGVSLEARAQGCKLFVVDRYDMYYGYALEEIRALGERCIVLVDVKTPKKLADTRVCGLILFEDEFFIR